MRTLHGRNGIRWSRQVNLRRGLADEDVEQQFARRTAEKSRRFAWSSRHPLVGGGPLDLEPATAQPPAQIVAAAADIAPQRSVHLGCQASGTSSVGPADVLVMHEELVEVRQRADPPQPEEADRWAGPDPRDKSAELVAPRESGRALRGESLEGPGQHEAGTGNEIAFPHTRWAARSRALQPSSRVGTDGPSSSKRSHSSMRSLASSGTMTAATPAADETHRATAGFAPEPNWLAPP